MAMSTPRAIRLILVPVDIVFFIVQIAREGTIGRLSNKPARDCQKDWVDFLPKKKTDFTNHENGVLQNGTSRFDLTGGNYNKLRFRCSAVPLFRCSAVAKQQGSQRRERRKQSRSVNFFETRGVR
jgi:hypothetical protein